MIHYLINSFFCSCVSCTPFQEYIDAHPETVILDPFPAIRTLLDRFESYKLIHKIEESMKGMYLCIMLGCFL